ncbi:MAG TPA: hypothetical protein DEV89_06775 [Erysipelotrichaceae bacterium]|nr:hypothetical protein [Erysipelotrichaceae bacterium]
MVAQVIDGLEIACKQQEAADVVDVVHLTICQLRLDILYDGLTVHELLNLCCGEAKILIGDIVKD